MPAELQTPGTLHVDDVPRQCYTSLVESGVRTTYFVEDAHCGKDRS